LLYKKINDNVDMMFKKGWINEVKNIYEKDKNIDKLNALKAIGYLDIINFLKNGTEIDKEKIKQNSRHYAKRQITWIRHHFDGKVIFNKDKKDIVLVVKKFLEK
jgi:tRNA dimethylallyltransferase